MGDVHGLFLQVLLPARGKQSRLCAIAALLLAFSAGADELEKATIRWVVFDQAPYWFSEPPLEGQGLGRKLLNLYTKALPQYDHRIVRVNVARYLREINSANTCIAYAWLSDKEKHLNQTRPITIEPPMGVFVLRKKEDLVESNNGWMDLTKTLDAGELRFGFIDKFDYGSQLNVYIEENSNKSNIVRFSPLAGEISLKLLDSNRLDLIIGMPVQGMRETLLDKENIYTFYNIYEIDNYISLYSHCSDDEAGNTALQAMDKVLSDELLAEFGRQYLKWYDNSPLFMEIYNDVVVKRKKRSDIYGYFK